MSSLTRRDFLNGTALAIAAGLTPADQLAADPARYPPALTGMRGQHPGSFETAHAFAWRGERFGIDGAAPDEHYDLVVVGGGISGLAAAYFYRRAAGANARILILDNCDDFGGHAKRNEFSLKRLLIGYGGSQSIQSPKTLWSDTAKGLLRDLGVDVARFNTAFDRGFYHSLGLSHGVFFDRETFGRDTLLPHDVLLSRGDAARSQLESFIAAMPIAETSKTQLRALYDAKRDPLAGKSLDEKRQILKQTSYRDYLIKTWGCSEEVANCFQGRPLGFFGLGIDAVAAADLRDFGYPGFAGLGFSNEEPAEWREPYIYHFPDGNASLARLLVRALIPDIAPDETDDKRNGKGGDRSTGKTGGAPMDAIVLAGFDYDRLDRDANDVRIRLDSTVIDVRQNGERVSIGYVRAGAPHRLTAKHAVLACFHMIIPYLMPELPAEQRAALSKNVKTPLVYTNVVVRNWQAFLKLQVSQIAAPTAFFSEVALDFPVDLGGYRHPRDPADAIVLHLEHVPGAPNSGLDARAQFRAGRQKLLTMTFADFETRIRDQLDRMLGPGGFASERDIAAITVNRWAHGYGYVANSLFDPDDYEKRVLDVARRTAGRVAIANSDAGGDAYAHLAIDQAGRAVHDLLGR
jgi:spermidine dehydrogenase